MTDAITNLILAEGIIACLRRRLDAGRPVVFARELVDDLKQLGYQPYFRLYAVPPKATFLDWQTSTQVAFVEHILDGLESMGLLDSWESPDSVNPGERSWRIKDETILPGTPNDGGGGRSGDPPNGGGAPPGGEGDDGLGEVLRHPVLFAVDDDDFEVLLEHLFSNGGVP